MTAPRETPDDDALEMCRDCGTAHEGYVFPPKSAPTPGPWKAEGTTVYTETRKDGPAVASCASHANARLIAAAPDLLAACEALATYIDGYEWGRPWAGRPHAIMDDARSALARAKGGAA